MRRIKLPAGLKLKRCIVAFYSATNGNYFNCRFSSWVYIRERQVEAAVIHDGPFHKAEGEAEMEFVVKTEMSS